MRSRESFNNAAELYDEIRPSYPDQLINWIIQKTGLKTDDNLLEIAPGTGQATRKFAEKDYKIHAVELGDNLAKVLMKNLVDYDVTVDVSSFEDWNSKSNEKYKLVYCATAWHWIDPEVKYKKSHGLLTNDGYLALIWNNATGTEDKEIMDEAYNLLFSYHKKHHILQSQNL